MSFGYADNQSRLAMSSMWHNIQFAVAMSSPHAVCMVSSPTVFISCARVGTYTDTVNAKNCTAA